MGLGGSLALQAAVCSAGGAGAAFGSGEAVWEAVPNGALPDSGPLGGGPPAPPARGSPGAWGFGDAPSLHFFLFEFLEPKTLNPLTFPHI